MPTGVRVARTSDLPPGSSKVIVVRGMPVALFNVSGTIYAVSNVCLHRGGPIAEGEVAGVTVTCPLHGWEYDLRTGRSATNPTACLKTFDVRIEGDDILVGP